MSMSDGCNQRITDRGEIEKIVIGMMRRKLPLPLRRGAFSSPEQICFRIRDLPEPPGQPTRSDDLRRSPSCGNIGLMLVEDRLKSYFSDSLSGKSPTSTDRINAERFTAWVPNASKSWS